MRDAVWTAIGRRGLWRMVSRAESFRIPPGLLASTGGETGPRLKTRPEYKGSLAAICDKKKKHTQTSLSLDGTNSFDSASSAMVGLAPRSARYSHTDAFSFGAWILSTRN